MNNKLIITKLKDHIISSLFENFELVQMSVEEAEKESILGNIYVGRVQNVVKNINAAFVEIGEKTIGYLALGENKNTVFLNKKNTDKVNMGDLILVQVTKENIKTKAPVLSSNINITGKFAVLTHGKNSVGVSNKIINDKKRVELKSIIQKYKNHNYGFIIRTNAVNADEEMIDKEINELTKIYTSIIEFGIHRTAFSLLYKAPANYLCDIRDGYSKEINEIVTDDNDIFNEIKNYLEGHQKEDLKKLRFYKDDLLSLSNLYSIKTRIEESLRERVWLKSGGYLVIQQTEALVVIDINTGKAIKGKKKLEEYFLKINIEAAKEVARQIRLRNLSGIIIVDFIDLEKKENRKMIMEELEKLLSKDPIKTRLVDMTALNLVEITRKKVRKSLNEQCKTCYF